MQSRLFEYFHDGLRCCGELWWDETQSQLLPGVLVVHEGGGINDHSKARARALAELGYVALACDMYGNGESTTDTPRRRELMGSLMADPERLRARARAALDALAATPGVDPTRLAAIGFCFGGLVVLELARSGAPLAGATSFHGILETKLPAERGVIKAKLLVCHGDADPFVPRAQVVAFQDEMSNAGVDWQLLVHGHTGHGFMNRNADALGVVGIAFNADAERRSWRALRGFFDELFGAG